ncbi:hypothetical protein CFB89_30890 [Burkholderia sp. AU16741]|uniref:DUF3472 domain-containing protein n=1 Tax=Burkholderia sp. AU16741 TaxID=2015347 RepID=UPI000B79B742|nr:DUF3472 domain-containing protein [Burkholderia sp. AU16741]OXI28639.1 hypothetical protein CFB89_30890 [Burkholderia sp. AU16741]
MKKSAGTLLRALACASLFATSASWGLTTTPSGSFVLSKGNNSSIDFSFNIQSDPGSKNYVFWAQQFGFETGPIGYLGLQRVGDTKKIIFSIWNAASSVALMEGAVAERFGGEGTGQHVIAPFDWQPGHDYQFRLENSGGAWWEVSVTDLTTSARWRLGKIEGAPAWGKLRKNVTTFTEVFVNSRRCESIPYARAAFGPPSSDNGVGRTTQVTARAYGTFGAPCTLQQLAGAKDGVNFGTRSDKVGSTLVHQIGLGNGPQNWGDFDRRGRIGAIFAKPNSTTGGADYFMLKALGPDGRYWYFPKNGSDNYFWSYLGNKEPSYNVNPMMALSDQMVRQENLDKLDASGAFIHGVLANSPVKSMQITTADGSWVSAINLPATTVDGAVVQAAIRSTWPVNVVVNGENIKLDKGSTKNFLYSYGEWSDRLPNVTVSSQPDLNKLDGAGNYLRTLLQHSDYVHIVTGDGHWVGQINFPSNAVEGATIRVSVRSTYRVTVAYGSGAITVVKGQSKLFKYLSNAWTPCQTDWSCRK